MKLQEMYQLGKTVPNNLDIFHLASGHDRSIVGRKSCAADREIDYIIVNLSDE